MKDIAERLRERPFRYAHETEDQMKIRRQREREEAADLIDHLRNQVTEYRSLWNSAVEQIARTTETQF